MKSFQSILASFVIINAIILLLKSYIGLVSVNFFLQQPRKYIIYECHGNCGGLADRFKGILNAFVWSLFTNRSFIINISQPCFFTNLMIPNKIDWNHSLLELVKNKKLKVNYKIYNIHKINDLKFKNKMENIDILRFKQNADIISVNTNLEWISAYSKNPYVI